MNSIRIGLLLVLMMIGLIGTAYADAPTQPTGVVATGANQTTISLSWQPSNDTDDAVAGYDIWRSVNNAGFIKIASVTDVSYIDTGVQTGITYGYNIVSFDSGGNTSSPSSTVFATLVGDDCPSSNTWPTSSIANAYGSWSSNTSTMTYYLNTSKTGDGIKEYCVYPSPGYTDSTNGLTAIYSGWSVDRPDSKTYFGFKGSALTADGSQNIPIGSAVYTNRPNSEKVLLQLTSGGWYWIPTTDVPTVTPTPNVTVTPTPTPTVTPTPNVTVTPTPTPTVIPTPNVTVTPTPIVTPKPLPSQPLCYVAIVEGPTTIELSWRASTDDVGIAGYNIYRSTDNVSFHLLANVTNTSYVDTGLTTNVTYYYYIVAVDVEGDTSIPSNTIYTTPRDILPPVLTVPYNIVAEATSSRGVVVNFSASATDDVDGNITPICLPSSGSTFPLGITTVTCSATDAAGNTASAIFSITVRDTTPPTPPSNLVATAVSTSEIDLSWNTSYDAVGVTGYRIYRSLDNINFTLIATRVTNSYRDTGLVQNTTYYYYVMAFDAAGNPSNNSNTASATTFVPPPSPTPGPTSTPAPTSTPGPTGTPAPTSTGGGGSGDLPPTLTLPANMILEATSPSGAVGIFSITASDVEDGNLTNNITCSPVSGSTFRLGITTVICSVTDSAGLTTSGGFTVTVRDTTPPTAPSGLTATAISASEIDLSWTASYDAVGVADYTIYRSLDNKNFTPIGISHSISYQNTGLTQNATYYYYIIASDAAGNPSNNSNIASATTFIQPPNPPPTPGPTSTPGPAPSVTSTTSPCSSSDNTQVGQNVTTTLTGSIINLNFGAITGCGNTTSTSYGTNNQWSPLPSGFQAVEINDMQTTASYQSYITISISGYQLPSNIDENTLRLFHYENGNWTDITTALDTSSHTITGKVSSLSPFAIAGMSSNSGGGSGGGGGGGGSGSSGRVLGASLDIIGFIILSLCLITISIYRLRKK